MIASLISVCKEEGDHQIWRVERDEEGEALAFNKASLSLFLQSQEVRLDAANR